ncbi:hypothetical protein BGX29_002812 [Mortierella sp. GBA35]|nr:hypothetical protein BGX29_002812 [Mortierella sp. GBA35]
MSGSGRGPSTQTGLGGLCTSFKLIPLTTRLSNMSSVTSRGAVLVAVLSIIWWLAWTSSVAVAQSPGCYNCIQKNIPKVQNCTSLSTSHHATLEKVMYGVKLYESSSEYVVADPEGQGCLVSLMWEIVHYNAQLWSHCLNPVAACSWIEMTSYMAHRTPR